MDSTILQRIIVHLIEVFDYFVSLRLSLLFSASFIYFLITRTFTLPMDPLAHKILEKYDVKF